uniref:Beta-hexosaminidase bacterial type N-terminal domain-containing protein n=1 Tax=Rhodosorus marinus TaxID=101924 RepID=A0A7S0G5N9_9RHOD|mmetsp:Transcript_23999/g.34529  ORF Transcript_23999/g.34529 Transcript_23999/m.34529 type:complete len:1352 (+) Transcript_23999:91-4146(+)
MFKWRDSRPKEGSPRGIAEGADPVELLAMLHFSASAGRTDAAREALNVGADLNGLLQVEVGGVILLETALHAAAKCGHVDVVRLLLSEGADASIRDSGGLTPVESAAGMSVTMAFVTEMCQRAAKGDANGVAQILNAGLDPNIPDAASNTGLHWACAYGMFTSADCLIKFGADVNSINSRGDSPLNEAEARNAPEIVRLLISVGALRGADIHRNIPGDNRPSLNGRHAAVNEQVHVGNPEVAGRILSQGGVPDAQSLAGELTTGVPPERTAKAGLDVNPRAHSQDDHLQQSERPQSVPAPGRNVAVPPPSNAPPLVTNGVQGLNNAHLTPENVGTLREGLMPASSLEQGFSPDGRRKLQREKEFMMDNGTYAARDGYLQRPMTVPSAPRNWSGEGNVRASTTPNLRPGTAGNSVVPVENKARVGNASAANHFPLVPRQARQGGGIRTAEGSGSPVPSGNEGQMAYLAARTRDLSVVDPNFLDGTQQKPRSPPPDQNASTGFSPDLGGIPSEDGPAGSQFRSPPDMSPTIPLPLKLDIDSSVPSLDSSTLNTLHQNENPLQGPNRGQSPLITQHVGTPMPQDPQLRTAPSPGPPAMMFRQMQPVPQNEAGYLRQPPGIAHAGGEFHPHLQGVPAGLMPHTQKQPAQLRTGESGLDGFDIAKQDVGEAQPENGFASTTPSWATMLWPPPQRFYMMSTANEFFLPPELTISAKKSIFSIASKLSSWLQSCDLDPNVTVIAPQHGRGLIHLSMSKGLFGGRNEAYKLTVHPNEVSIVGSDAAGLFYGCCTFDQIVRLLCSGGGRTSLPCCSVTDWPSLAQRSVMLDISRGKVMSASTLRQLIERLAKLKYNQVQLYMEHTFGYLGHEEVWRDSGAMSPEDVMSLDEYCIELFVELVPFQSSLSGFNKWVKNPKYTHLAECPDEVDVPGLDTSDPRGRMSLCVVDPKSIDFITDLYEQLLPCFSSSQLHVGIDRALDLGRGRSAKEVSSKGVETVIVEYLRKICHEANSHGKTTVHFWADALESMLDYGGDMSDFSMLLPEGVIAVERGTEHDHPYDSRCYRLSSIGVPFMVCASTSSQNSFAGRVSNCLENIRSAAIAAVSNAAVGMIISDSGENGHLQPLVAAYPGFIAGAGAAWNCNQALRTTDGDMRKLAALLDSHIFMDSEDTAAVGSVLVTVGDLHLVAEDRERDSVNSTAAGVVGYSRLFRLLIHDGDSASLAGLSPRGIQRALNRLEKALELLNAYQGMAGRIDVEEVRLMVEMLRLCLRIGTCVIISNRQGTEEFALRWLPDGQRSDLCLGLLHCIDMQKYIWGKRNRLAGFEGSWAWLEPALLSLSIGLPHLEQTVRERREVEWKF